MTNHPLLVSVAERNYDLFKVSTSLVDSTKSKRYYTPQQQADLDIKTSVNKIGEIVNLSQELQTLMWHKLNNGATFEEVKEIYYDVCQLNVMSGIEIDMAKKEFDINNADELRQLRQKWVRKDDEGRNIKPYFFGHIDRTKGFYNEEKKNYVKHDTAMDYLREIIETHRTPNVKNNTIPLSDILVNVHNRDAERRAQVKQIMYQIHSFKQTSYYIWNGYAELDERYKYYVEAEDELIDSINSSSVNLHTIYSLIKRLENEKMSDIMIKVLFNIGNQAAFQLIQRSQDGIEILEEAEDGDITIFSKNYKKMQKNAKSFTTSDF